jgi:enoyl-CoA hydratase/carnithine racemase
MNQFQGRYLSWSLAEGVIEMALHRDPCNEIGLLAVEELETFAGALDGLARDAHALIVHSTLKAGFCAGADLRELYFRSKEMEKARAVE